MEIVKQQFTGDDPSSGRPNKYPFDKLEVGDCLRIPITDIPRGAKERKRVSNAFYGWRKYNGKLDWTTAVRIEDKGTVICVYRYE